VRERHRAFRSNPTPSPTPRADPSTPPRPPSVPAQLDAGLPAELAWVPPMIRASYFAPCPNHTLGGKGELTNLFCIPTLEAVASCCAGGREVVQVRPSLTSHDAVSRPIFPREVVSGRRSDAPGAIPGCIVPARAPRARSGATLLGFATRVRREASRRSALSFPRPRGMRNRNATGAERSRPRRSRVRRALRSRGARRASRARIRPRIERDAPPRAANPPRPRFRSFPLRGRSLGTAHRRALDREMPTRDSSVVRGLLFFPPERSTRPRGVLDALPFPGLTTDPPFPLLIRFAARATTTSCACRMCAR